MSKLNGKSFNGSPVSLVDDDRMPSRVPGIEVVDAIERKDPRWNAVIIAEPIIRETMEWLKKDVVWDGKAPKITPEIEINLLETVSDAVYKAFDLALDEVRQACNAFSMWPDEVEYPAKYLRDYKHL